VRRTLLAALLLAGVTTSAGAQVTGQGTAFWGCWPRSHLSLETSAELVVMADDITDVVVDGAFTYGPVRVGPGAPIRIPLPPDLRMASGQTVVDTGFRVRTTDSTRPISVLLRVPRQAEASDDIARLLPVEELGTVYRVGAYRASLPGEPSFYAIVATQDATTLDVGLQCAGTSRITLNAGQAWQALCQWSNVPPDVTGASIIANKPVAVLAGCSDAFVPSDWLSGNFVVEALLPTVRWGSEFVVPGLPKGPRAVAGAADRIRVVASVPCTVNVEQATGTTSFPLAGGGLWFEASVAGGAHVVSTAPVQLHLFAPGVEISDLGDPFMAEIPPVTNWSMAARAYVPADYSEGAFVTVMTTVDAIDSVRLDGVLVTGWVTSPGGVHAWAEVPVPISGGEHLVTGASRLAALVHGYNAEYAPQPGLGRTPGSFGYPAPAAVPPCLVFPGADVPSSACAGTVMQLEEAGSAAVNCAGGLEYRWLMNGVPIAACSAWSRNASCSAVFTTTAVYTLEARCATDPTCEGNAVSLVRDVPAQAIAIEPDPATVCAGSPILLRAPLGFTGYSWTSVPVDPGVTPRAGAFDTLTATPDVDTRYTVVVTDARGCPATDDLVVTTLPDPLPLALGASVRVRKLGAPAPADVEISWTDLAGANVAGYEVVFLDCAGRLFRTECGWRLPDPPTIQASPLVAPQVPPGTQLIVHAGAFDLGDLIFYKVRATSPCANRPGPTCNPWPHQIPPCP
jgi:hypothetical protein